MKTISLVLMNLLVLVSSTRSEYDLGLIFKGWETTCKITSCESTLNQCIENSCIGKLSCRSCVETYLTSCSRCVDDIYDETTQITLPDNRKTIICDMSNQLHTTVCHFFCRSLFKLNYKCEIISDMPLCNCMDTTPTPTTTTTFPTTRATTTSTTSTTTTKKPDDPSNMSLK